MIKQQDQQQWLVGLLITKTYNKCFSNGKCSLRSKAMMSHYNFFTLEALG